MEFTSIDHLHLQHALGYLGLGMLVEANEDLDNITPELSAMWPNPLKAAISKPSGFGLPCRLRSR